jgi:hypothetical protein
MSHDEFFARFGHMCIDSSMRADYETVYQAFKSRLIEELRVSSPELLRHADVIDIRPIRSLGHPQPQTDRSGAVK